jgi:hypothetical protein
MMIQSSHRFYLIIDLGIIPAVVNFSLNGSIAWIMYQSLAVVPFWGIQSISSETLSTTLLLPLITFLIITPLARRELRRERFPAIELPHQLHQVLNRIPNKTIIRAFVLGILSLIIFGPISLLTLSSLEILQLSFWQFVVFKAIFAAGLGLIVTPLIGLWALGDSRTNTNTI